MKPAGLRYQANIRHNKLQKYIGTYDTQLEAAKHYDACSRKLRRTTKNRRTTKLNFPDKTDFPHICLPKWLQWMIYQIIYGNS